MSTQSPSTFETLILETNKELQQINFNTSFLSSEDETSIGREPLERCINKKILNVPENFKQRFRDEYFGSGPLETLFKDDDINEIIINNWNSIWYEKKGQLKKSTDHFYSQLTFDMFLKRFFIEIGEEPTLSHPFVDSDWDCFRVHIIGSMQNHESPRLTFRKHNKNILSFDEICDKGWCSNLEKNYILNLLNERKNFIIVGPTSSGKTTVLKSLLNILPPNERVITIEDSLEIGCINPSSTNLLSRFDPREILPSITLSDLVRQTLRMRPDRLVVGEVRGGEAKDLLMALSTGHHGSAGTLHASNPHQALIRLEMLIQMGAPHWSLSAIRKLISMSLDYLIVCGKNKNSQRQLKGIYKLVGIEESGLIIEEAAPAFD